MVTTRRNLLDGAVAGVLATAWPAWMPRMAFAPAHTAPRGDVLICIFLRGAADVLNIVVPHGEESYYRSRPTLNIPRPDDKQALPKQRTIDLDGFFGLHPAMLPLTSAWQQKHLAFVHACGAPDESRSHFLAMELMERGVEAQTGPASGWIGRHLATLDTGNQSPLRAIGLGERVPQLLQGPVPATALRSITDFHLGSDKNGAQKMQAALSLLYKENEPIGRSGQVTIELLNTINALDPDNYKAGASALYPESDFGRGMRQVAMLIKAEVGLEVACLDVGGWDTHFAQGGSEGLMADLLSDLGAGLSAFHADMRDHMDRLLVVTLSEFGRRLQENGSLGTDHGHGSMMMLMGGGIQGGKVHGEWPGLAPEQLVGPGDLAVTCDYRDILGELIKHRLNNPSLTEIFPGYSPRFKGVTKT